MLAAQQDDNAVKHLKVPPHSIEAEQSVLGGIMIDNEMLEVAQEFVCEQDFYVRNHRLVFRAMHRLTEQGRPLDVITMSDFMEQNGIEEIGLAFLGELARNTPSIANIKAYAEIVREKSVTRKLIKFANEVSDKSFNPDGLSLNELLEFTQTEAVKIATVGQPSAGGMVSNIEVLKRTIEQIELAQNCENGITGVATGFDDLDQITAGLQPADLVIVAGRPSMGKTAFAMNLARNIGHEAQYPVAIFSLEMPKEALEMRNIAAESNLPLNVVKTNRITTQDQSQSFVLGVNKLKDCKLLWDDTAKIPPSHIKSQVNQIIANHGGCEAIIVDYLQLMEIAGTKENRTQEVSQISRELKAIAKHFNIPLIALSQLNRGLENRSCKRPVMADLRESGAIEQDADLILFLYRDEVYNPDGELKGLAEVIIGKHRNGPLGTVNLMFDGETMQFKPLAQGYYPQTESEPKPFSKKYGARA